MGVIQLIPETTQLFIVVMLLFILSCIIEYFSIRRINDLEKSVLEIDRELSLIKK